MVGRWKKKEPAQRERKKERERLPKESQGSEWKRVRKREGDRWEGERERKRAREREQGPERKEEGGEDASYSAQHPRWRWQRLPSSLKSIIKKYIRGHLRFSSAS